MTADVWDVTPCSLVKVQWNSPTMMMKAEEAFLSGCTTSQPTGTKLHSYY